MPPSDSGVPPGPDPELLLGTGELVLTPTNDGDVVALSRGFQGLQHVWVCARFQAPGARAGHPGAGADENG